jgi:hypothetical protein
MLSVAIYIKDVQTGQYNRVDLFDDEKISVVSSIQNINDISKTFTDFSQTFTVPASKQNNKIFRHWYDNSNDEPFSTLVKADAYIEIDTITFRKGKIQLESANVEDGQAKDYSITFIGLLGNLKDKFNGLYLKDLTDTTYDFNYNATLVKEKVISTSTSGNVMFPLITSGNLWQYGTGYNINNSSTPIFYDNLFPAIKLSAVLNMIANDSNILNLNFNGLFLSDARFTNAYLWLKNADEFKTNLFQKIDFTTKGNLEDLYRVEVNLTDNYFVRAAGGSTKITITPQSGFTTVPYTVYRYLNGERWDTYIDSNGGTTSFIVRTDADRNKHSFYIETSQAFEFVFKIDMGTYTSGYTKSATMSAQTVSANISVASYMPEIKIEDFFSGLLKMFNLTCYSEDGINYTVDTLENYYLDGSDIDITKYVIQDKKSLNRVKTHKKINFDYEKSESLINVGFNSTNGIEYGSLHYSNNPPAEGEEYSIKLPFENLNFSNLQDKLQVGYALKTDLQKYIPKPVILYDYNPTELTSLTSTSFYFSTPTTQDLCTAYKAFGQETLISGETYGLNFNEQQSTLTNEIVQNGLYQTYYSKYFANIFNYKARLTKISAILPTSILTTLKLNDTILIRDTKYLINTMTTDLTSGVAQFELLTDQRVVEPLPIITENLVLNLDAGNPLSYPGTGTTWTDLTTNGNNGTLINGPTFDSANGGSIVFDGTNDYINLGNILNFERTDEFSISTWINVSSLTNYGMILCKMDINQKGYFLYFEPTGAIGFCLRNTFNTNEILTFTQNTISLNNWVNICVTYNGNSLASGVIFYLNNINQTNTVSKDLLSASIINTSNNSIGSRINFNNGYVNGKISIVTVYNKELSATEVLQNFNATKNRYGL